MPTRTIPRNATRQIAAIKARKPRCVVRSLRNDFAAHPCDAEWAWKDLASYHQARLTERSASTWHISVHGNLWYELTATTEEGTA